MRTRTRSETSRGRRSAAPLTAILSGLFVAGAIAFAPSASAHDELIDNTPGDDETVSAPEEVVLTFNAELLEIGAVIEVEGPDGAAIEGEPVVSGAVATQALQADLPAGEYSVAWRVTSSDGHPISDTFAFTVEAAQDEPTEEVPTTDPAPDPTTETEGTEATPPEDTEASPEPEETAPAEDTATEPAGTEPVEGTEPPAESEAPEETEPTTAAPSPSESDDNEADTSEGMPGWAWVLIAAAVVGLAALVVVWSRRAGAQEGDQPESQSSGRGDTDPLD